MSLPLRQQRFLEEYLVDLNGTQAAIRAGYAKIGAATQADKLLRKPEIAELVRLEMQRRSIRTHIKADRVLQELALVGFSDIGDVLDFSGEQPKLRPPSQIPESARRCISSVRVKRQLEGSGDNAVEVEVTEFKLWDKLQALEKIGKHLGMFLDRIELSGKAKLILTEEIVDGDSNRSSNDPPA